MQQPRRQPGPARPCVTGGSSAPQPDDDHRRVGDSGRSRRRRGARRRSPRARAPPAAAPSRRSPAAVDAGELESPSPPSAAPSGPVEVIAKPPPGRGARNVPERLGQPGRRDQPARPRRPAAAVAVGTADGALIVSWPAPRYGSPSSLGSNALQGAQVLGACRESDREVRERLQFDRRPGAMLGLERDDPTVDELVVHENVPCPLALLLPPRNRPRSSESLAASLGRTDAHRLPRSRLNSVLGSQQGTTRSREPTSSRRIRKSGLRWFEKSWSPTAGTELRQARAGVSRGQVLVGALCPIGDQIAHLLALDVDDLEDLAGVERRSCGLRGQEPRWFRARAVQDSYGIASRTSGIVSRRRCVPRTQRRISPSTPPRAIPGRSPFSIDSRGSCERCRAALKQREVRRPADVEDSLGRGEVRAPLLPVARRAHPLPEAAQRRHLGRRS